MKYIIIILFFIFATLFSKEPITPAETIKVNKQHKYYHKSGKLYATGILFDKKLNGK